MHNKIKIKVKESSVTNIILSLNFKLKLQHINTYTDEIIECDVINIINKSECEF